jgi:hypothetical protein
MDLTPAWEAVSQLDPRWLEESLGRAVDTTHRGHAVIEQVHADLTGAAPAHLPSGVFTANAAWLCSPRSRSTSPAPQVFSPEPTWPSHHGHRPPQVHPRPSPRRFPRTPPRPGPSTGLARADGLDRNLHPARRPTHG